MTVYFDYNASAPVRKEVLIAMVPHFRELHGNPSSVHFIGRQARAAVEESRNAVASFIGADPSEILFLSGGTEANNLAITGTLALKEGALVVSAIEHPAVYNLAKKMEKAGRQVFYVGVDENCRVRVDELEQILRQYEVALVSIMAANNETGVIQPIEEIGILCQDTGVSFHTDAAQLVGKMPFSVDYSDFDMASIAAHKMGGPLGIGALYIREGTELERLMEGGGQELNRRPGTEAVALMVGLGEACNIAEMKMDEEIDNTRRLRHLMEKKIISAIKHVTINGVDAARLPGTSNIRIQGISAEMLVIRLDLEGFAVSAGSACHAGRTVVSRTLTAMGLSEEEASSSIRVSLGPENTREEVNAFVETLTKVVKDIRARS